MRNVVLLLLFTVASVGAQVPKLVLPEPGILRWYVHVINGLSNGDLLVHCQSKDDDLGNQLLHHGNDFQWNFNINIWGTTLFWCRLEKPGAYVSFEAFWSERRHTWLFYRCVEGRYGNCVWTAKDDGIYLQNKGAQNVDELIHKWIPT